MGGFTVLVLPPRTVVFDDAHVEAWHEDHPDELIDQGGAFSSRGPFTLTNSTLTASWIVYHMSSSSPHRWQKHIFTTTCYINHV